MIQGTVQFVETAVAGDTPLEDAPVGSTEIRFEDAVDFNEDGGQIRVSGVILPYSSADLEQDIIYLEAPLTFPVTVQDLVEVFPEASETVATVVDRDGSIDAIVPYPMRPLLPDGPRQPEEGEVVLLEDDEYGRPTVVDIPNIEPSMDARFVSNAEELLLENRKRLGELLAQNEAAIVDAQGRLSTAEGRIVDAFDEIELKPDKDYVDAAEQQAKDWANLAVSNLEAITKDSISNPSNMLVNGSFDVQGDGARFAGWTVSGSVGSQSGSGDRQPLIIVGALTSTAAVCQPGRTYRAGVHVPVTPSPVFAPNEAHLILQVSTDAGASWSEAGRETITAATTAPYEMSVLYQATSGSNRLRVIVESNGLGLRINNASLYDYTDLLTMRQEAIAEAIDAAADDAAAKAAAAQSAAVDAAQEALTQAQTDLQAAIASGDADAIADAEAKIATAKQEAIAAAEADATAKAGEAMQKANAALTAAQSAQATADNAIRTYYAETPPWESGTTQPDDVLGDMWYKDSTGQAYRWNGTTWKVIQDASIGEALAAAADAQTTADGKITAYYQPNEPLEADEGDLWFDTDDDSALHRRTGGQWVALLDPKALADEAESNAIAFATERTDGLAKTLWSTSLPGTTTAPQNSVWYRVDGDEKIIAVFTQTAAGSAGNTWIARPITSEAIDNLDVGKLTAFSGTVNDLVANTFAAKLADIIEANIGNLTVTGDTHLEDLVAQTIAGDTASFMSLTVDQILAGFLQAEWIITETGAIIAGNPDGARVEIRHDGVSVYVVGPNGAPYEAVSMRNGEISFGVIGQDGTRLGGISSTGAVSGTSGIFSKDVKIKGTPMLGQVGGGTIPGWMDNLPRGVIARNFKSTSETSIVTGVERAYLRANATLYPGRQYRVRATMRANLAAEGGALTLALRWSTTAPATLSSAQLPNTMTFSFPNASANHRIVGWAEGFLEVDVVTKARLLLTYKGDYGATPAASSTYLYIEDVGPIAPVSGGDEEGPDTTLYRSTWRATATRRYYKSGEVIPGEDGKVETWYWFATPTDFKNVGILWGGGAVESTDSIEMGKTQAQALNGATIHKSEIFLKNKVWNSDDEGPLALSSLSGTSLPSWKTIDATFWGGTVQAGEGVWVEVPTSWFTNGANRGICIGDKDGRALDGSGVLAYLRSGIFHGLDDTEPPLIRHTYSR